VCCARSGAQLGGTERRHADEQHGGLQGRVQRHQHGCGQAGQPPCAVCASAVTHSPQTLRRCSSSARQCTWRPTASGCALSAATTTSSCGRPRPPCACRRWPTARASSCRAPAATGAKRPHSALAAAPTRPRSDLWVGELLAAVAESSAALTGLTLFAPSSSFKDATVAVLMACRGGTLPQRVTTAPPPAPAGEEVEVVQRVWRKVVVHRHRRVVHVYDMREHGRRSAARSCEGRALIRSGQVVRRAHLHHGPALVPRRPSAGPRRLVRVAISRLVRVAACGCSRLCAARRDARAAPIRRRTRRGTGPRRPSPAWSSRAACWAASLACRHGCLRASSGAPTLQRPESSRPRRSGLIPAVLLAEYDFWQNHDDRYRACADLRMPDGAAASWASPVRSRVPTRRRPSCAWRLSAGGQAASARQPA
jgi:hypothetical protein